MCLMPLPFKTTIHIVTSIKYVTGFKLAIVFTHSDAYLLNVNKPAH
jgi:hypothetical protein